MTSRCRRIVLEVEQARVRLDDVSQLRDLGDATRVLLTLDLDPGSAGVQRLDVLLPGPRPHAPPSVTEPSILPGTARPETPVLGTVRKELSLSW